MKITQYGFAVFNPEGGLECTRLPFNSFKEAEAYISGMGDYLSYCPPGSYCSDITSVTWEFDTGLEVNTQISVQDFIIEHQIVDQIASIEAGLKQLAISYEITLDYDNYSDRLILLLVVQDNVDTARKAVANYRKEIAQQGVDFAVTER